MIVPSEGGRQPCECTECLKAIQIKYLTLGAVGHMQTHMAAAAAAEEVREKFPCTSCDKVFMYRNGLNSHMFTHNPTKQFQCPYCGKLFAQQTTLSAHVITHNAEKRTRQCPHCHKMYSTKMGLLNHKISVHGFQTEFQCLVCAKYFPNTPQLDRHMLVHTNEKPCGCSMCEKTFRDQKALRIHMIFVHGKKTGIQCEVCGKYFPNSCALRRHIKKHS